MPGETTGNNLIKKSVSFSFCRNLKLRRNYSFLGRSFIKRLYKALSVGVVGLLV